MAKEILRTIAEAEAEAERIRAKAQTDAQTVLANAEAAGKALLARTEEELTAAGKAEVKALTEKIDSIRESSREKNAEETAALKKTAEVRMREAVRIVMGEVAAQCQ